jgi:glyoxylase-like metal-dependent hydrolase (beta-lactamase superfamily II)
MNIIPFIHEGLGNSSYLVGVGEGNALLVDPDRTTQRYLDVASARGWRISTVLETHLHADFVSGAHELASALGAKLFVPEGEGLALPHQGILGSERWTLDGVEIESVASPGHTPEHMSYVIRAGARPPALFSGGSLMVGGAARTDLISPDMTDALTRAQYRTLKTAFSDLPDETGLYATHGGGSFCSSRSTGGSRTSTLGAERSSNPLLAIDNEDEFAAWFPTTFPSAPAYYFRMRAFNQAVPRLRRDIQPPPLLTREEFNDRRRDAIVIDARPIGAYAKAHLPGSLNIEFRDAFAVWLGWLAPADARLLFVAGDTPVERLIDESLLVGYEHLLGVLEGDIPAWERAGLPFLTCGLITAAAAKRALLDGATVLDVREPSEFASGHIPDALNVPLGKLAGRVSEVPRDRPVVAYCGHGERSATALSLLERSGRADLLNLDGGLGAWSDAGFRVTT